MDTKLLDYLETFITENRKQRFLEILKNRSNYFTVAVEDVYQLHNTSAVMRSCEVFGVQKLNVIEEKFGKRIDDQIALGAQKWVDIIRHQNSKNCMKALKEQGYQIIATTPHENATLLEDFDISKPSALFFGTEKTGLSKEVMQNADGFLKIPMVGFTESLNISVSAAIILQNLMTRLRKSNYKWQLTEKDFFEKRLDWTKKSIKDIDFIEQRYFQSLKSI